MDRFLQYAVTGLSAGSLYALVALGLVLIYKSMSWRRFAAAAGGLATICRSSGRPTARQHLPFYRHQIGTITSPLVRPLSL